MILEEEILKLKESLKSQLKLAEKLSQDIDKKSKVKENSFEIQTLKNKIEKQTNELVKQVYSQRDKLKNEIKSIESNLKNNLNDNFKKELCLVDKISNEARKYLTNKDLNEECLKKYSVQLNDLDKVLKEKIKQVEKIKLTEYQFLASKSVISSDLNGKIKQVLFYLNISYD